MMLFTVHVIDRDFNKYQDLLNLMFRQRYDIFCQECHFAEGDHETKMEIDEYDQDRNCVYFLCLEDGTLAASSRLVLADSGIDLPIITAGFEIDKEIEKNSAEISRFIVDKNLRSNPIHFYTTVLGYNMYVYVNDRHIEYCYALMEEQILNFIRGVIGCDFTQIGKPKYYMGGTLIPAELKVRDVRIFGA